MGNAAPILLMLFELKTGRRPQKLEPFWLSLDKAEFQAPAEGIVALRAPIERHVLIAGAKFVMGSTELEMQKGTQLCSHEPLGPLCRDALGQSPFIRAEGHVHEVTLSSYEIDSTEVSVQRYRRCVSAGACGAPSFPIGDQRYDHADFPVTHVSWNDAESFCKWEGGHLPTEAQWEYAARGPQKNDFPWGNIYNPHLANHGSFSEDGADARDGWIGLAPIGSFPDGMTPTGIYDLAGNASEWVADYYDRDEDGFGYPRAAATDPKGPAFSAYGHVVRGGSYRDGAHLMRGASREFSLVGGTREIGFRCAYAPGSSLLQ